MDGSGGFSQISKSAPTNAKPVGAVAAAVRVLRYLAGLRQPAGVSQIAKETGLYSSTCFNILRTLAQDDLVTFDENAKTYTLGLGIIEFAQGILSKGGFMAAIRAEMNAMARDGGFSMTLWRRVPDRHNIVIASADSGRPVQIHIGIGERLPTYIGATGRAVAAAEPVESAALGKEFERLRWERPLSFADYLKQIEQTKAQGWAVDDGYYRQGLVTLAVPVSDLGGTVRLLIAAHMFSGEFTAVQQDEIAARMKAIAAKAQAASAANVLE